MNAIDTIHALPEIFHCGILQPEKVQALEKLNGELEETWHKRQVFRTETEMRFSVLNDGTHPTPASKYWQCVREQAMMLDNLALVAFDYRRNEVALKRHQRRLTEAEDELDREEAQIDIDECLFKRLSMQQNANDRVREIELWSELKAELDDGSFDTEQVNTHQMQSLYLALQERFKCLTQASTQPEVLNVVGPLQTLEKALKRGN